MQKASSGSCAKPSAPQPSLDEGNKEARRPNWRASQGCVNGPNAEEGDDDLELHLGFATLEKMCTTSLPLRKCRSAPSRKRASRKGNYLLAHGLEASVKCRLWSTIGGCGNAMVRCTPESWV